MHKNIVYFIVYLSNVYFARHFNNLHNCMYPETPNQILYLNADMQSRSTTYITLNQKESSL